MYSIGPSLDGLGGFDMLRLSSFFVARGVVGKLGFGAVTTRLGSIWLGRGTLSSDGLGEPDTTGNWGDETRAGVREGDLEGKAAVEPIAGIADNGVTGGALEGELAAGVLEDDLFIINGTLAADSARRNLICSLVLRGCAGPLVLDSRSIAS